MLSVHSAHAPPQRSRIPVHADLLSSNLPLLPVANELFACASSRARTLWPDSVVLYLNCMFVCVHACACMCICVCLYIVCMHRLRVHLCMCVYTLFGPSLSLSRLPCAAGCHGEPQAAKKVSGLRAQGNFRA